MITAGRNSWKAATWAEKKLFVSWIFYISTAEHHSLSSRTYLYQFMTICCLGTSWQVRTCTLRAWSAIHEMTTFHPARWKRHVYIYGSNDEPVVSLRTATTSTSTPCLRSAALSILTTSSPMTPEQLNDFVQFTNRPTSRASWCIGNEKQNPAGTEKKK